MKISILNNLRGDSNSEIDTSNADGRKVAAKLVGDLLRSGSAVFLEKEINGTTYTYRVTGYNPDTNRLVIRLDTDTNRDPDIMEVNPRKRGPYRTRKSRVAMTSARDARVVSVAPRSGG